MKSRYFFFFLDRGFIFVIHVNKIFLEILHPYV